MKVGSRWFGVVLAALLVLTHPAAAAVTMPRVFSDHMVLQRDRPVPVWGWAAPGEKVTVEFAGQRKDAVAAADGRWEARLDPMPARGQGGVLRVVGADSSPVERTDVVVGEVWVCSGQSNMALELAKASNAPDDIARADLGTLRFFGVFNVMAATPQRDVKSKTWVVCSTQTAAACSAVAFYFGRRLNAELGVPVGLINSCWGGTRIEPWTPREAFDSLPELASPEALNAPVTNKSLPTVIYNAKIHPLIPYAMRGVIWYQGEQNADDPGALYFHQMRALIGGWRHAWALGEFPFYFVQLASWSRDRNVPAGGGGWASLRESQFKATAITNAGMAVAIDIGDARDIHPRNKFDVGERLARWALARDYGRTNLVVSGPLYRGMTSEGNRIRLFFDHVDGGLMVGDKDGREPTREVPGGRLERFAIAGATKTWVWADASIDGDTVCVSSPAVPKPVAVRYAYSNNPEGCNLYNRAGLPASPFRTDEW